MARARARARARACTLVRSCAKTPGHGLMVREGTHYTMLPVCSDRRDKLPPVGHLSRGWWCRPAHQDANGMGDGANL